MGFGEPKMPTPEEMAKIQKERALSDAELLKGGAEYVADEKGVRLETTAEQISNAKNEMEEDNVEKENSYREKVLDARIARVQEAMQNMLDTFEYVREHADYKSMSKSEFLTFENNFAVVTHETDMLVGNFLLHKNNMKVRHEDWAKWLSERK